MQEILERLLNSIANNTLVVMFGAGISMEHPSNVPSAARLAVQMVAEYRNRTGRQIDLTNVPDPLGTFSRHFYPRQLEELARLADWTPFRRDPNAAHQAIADFVCSNAVVFSLTTNYDVLVERAASILGEHDFETYRDVHFAEGRPSKNAPVLKLHGCVEQDRYDLLWCSEQLQDERWHDRIERVRNWLTARLAGKDLLMIGFWSDWAYLSAALHQCLHEEMPRTVVLVDPEEDQVLTRKAPDLWTWSNRGEIDFLRVRAGAMEFLQQLRISYSRVFIRNVCQVCGQGDWWSDMFVNVDTMNDLYDIRRDLSGVDRNSVVRDKPSDVNGNWETVSGTIYEFFLAGHRYEGALIRCGDISVRVINGAGKRVETMRAKFHNESLAADSDLVVCAGADPYSGAPYSVARGHTRPTVTRPGLSAEWLDHTSALVKLNIREADATNQ